MLHQAYVLRICIFNFASTGINNFDVSWQTAYAFWICDKVDRPPI